MYCLHESGSGFQLSFKTSPNALPCCRLSRIFVNVRRPKVRLLLQAQKQGPQKVNYSDSSTSNGYTICTTAPASQSTQCCYRGLVEKPSVYSREMYCSQPQKTLESKFLFNGQKASSLEAAFDQITSRAYHNLILCFCYKFCINFKSFSDPV